VIVSCCRFSLSVQVSRLFIYSSVTSRGSCDSRDHSTCDCSFWYSRGVYWPGTRLFSL